MKCILKGLKRKYVLVYNGNATCKVLSAVLMKIQFFWDMSSCE